MREVGKAVREYIGILKVANIYSSSFIYIYIGIFKVENLVALSSLEYLRIGRFSGVGGDISMGAPFSSSSTFDLIGEDFAQ